MYEGRHYVFRDDCGIRVKGGALFTAASPLYESAVISRACS